VADPGSYQAVYLGSHQVTYTDKATGDDASLLVWTFELPAAANADPLVVEGVSSLLLSARSKGFAWLRAIAPDVVAARQDVDAAALVGRRCIVVVEATAEGDARVTDVLPPVKGD